LPFFDTVIRGKNDYPALNLIMIFETVIGALGYFYPITSSYFYWKAVAELDQFDETDKGRITVSEVDADVDKEIRLRRGFFPCERNVLYQIRVPRRIHGITVNEFNHEGSLMPSRMSYYEGNYQKYYSTRYINDSSGMRRFTYDTGIREDSIPAIYPIQVNFSAVDGSIYRISYDINKYVLGTDKRYLIREFCRKHVAFPLRKTIMVATTAYLLYHVTKQ